MCILGSHNDNLIGYQSLFLGFRESLPAALRLMLRLRHRLWDWAVRLRAGWLLPLLVLCQDSAMLLAVQEFAKV